MTPIERSSDEGRWEHRVTYANCMVHPADSYEDAVRYAAEQRERYDCTATVQRRWVATPGPWEDAR